MNYQKGFARVWLLVITFVVIAIAVAWWLVTQKSPKTEAVNSDTVSQVTQMSQYTDGDLGFSFSYPSNLVVAPKITPFYSWSNRHTFLEVSSSTSRYYGRIIVNTQVEGTMGDEQTTVSTSTITISGVSANQQISTDVESGQKQLEFSFVKGDSKKGDSYFLSFPYTSSSDQATTNSIIESFHFTAASSSLKAYTDTTNGFSIRYPENIPVIMGTSSTIFQVGSSYKVEVATKGNAQSCLNVPEDPYDELGVKDEGTLVINGIQFRTYSKSGNWAGHFSQDRFYSAVRNSKCYVIETSAYDARPDVFPGEDRAKQQASIDSLMKEMESIAKSFQFN